MPSFRLQVNMSAGVPFASNPPLNVEFAPNFSTKLGIPAKDVTARERLQKKLEAGFAEKFPSARSAEYHRWGLARRPDHQCSSERSGRQGSARYILSLLGMIAGTQ